MRLNLKKTAVFGAFTFVFAFVFAVSIPDVSAKDHGAVINSSSSGSAVTSPDSSLSKPGLSVSETKETVLQARIHEYSVRRGDNLTKIENIFGVKKSVLLSAVLNPELAKRNNPDLIFVGEKIKIPLYRIVEDGSANGAVVPAFTVSALSDDMVMIPKEDFAKRQSEIKADQARIAQLTEDNV